MASLQWHSRKRCNVWLLPSADPSLLLTPTDPTSTQHVKLLLTWRRRSGRRCPVQSASGPVEWQ